MYSPAMPVVRSAVFDIMPLVFDYHQLSDANKKIRAYHFSYELIDLFNGSKLVKIPTAPLQGQLLSNFLSLVGLTIFEENKLNNQLNALRNKLSEIGMVVGRSAQYDQHWTTTIYTTFFTNRACEIYCEQGNYYALFYLSKGILYSNPHYMHQGYPVFYFDQLQALQHDRLFALAWSISTYFKQLSGHDADIVSQYQREGSEAWLNFIGSLIVINERLLGKPKNSRFWFQIGITIESPQLIYQWLLLGGEVTDLDTTIQHQVLKLAITHDHKPLVSRLIASGIIPTREEMESAKGRVAKFFSYQPGRSYMSLKTYLQSIPKNPQTTSLFIEDEANTSDENSSDDDGVNFRQVNHIAQPKNKTFLARGIHYTLGFYNTARRNAAKEVNSHTQMVCSRATADLASRVTVPGHPVNFVHADQLVKGYFQLLKLTPDKVELDSNYKKTHRTLNGVKDPTFSSLYCRFIQAYVNSYQSLFNEGGISRNFNFYSNNNPLLSLTPDITVAFRYASGERINHSVRYFPKVRKCTGELKHHRLGYVEVYLLETEYLNKHATDVGKLNDEKEIGLVHNYSFNKEITIESSIPAESILGFQIFSLPRMNKEWTLDIGEKYGLSKIEYDHFRTRLRTCTTEQDVRDTLKGLIEKVTIAQGQRLQRCIDAILKPGVPPQAVATPTITALTETLGAMNINVGL